MKFSISAVVLALATIAVAAPGGYGYGGEKDGDITIAQDSHARQCGAQTALSCCNEATNESSGFSILDKLLGNIELLNFKNCGSLALGDPCSTNVACCQGDSSATGLIALNLPCIPVQL
ncbi:hypothetical protein EMCG_00070 [[Emmonsia] crescens]|uniref:Hydrophobin n=1 Tax=[Emmonsia] crescens TaxID=73230 RepID=A0A0G2J801_9EURO|nr:hypothetical protein EMCG_00070 [Emmonsia crescens UAMH 3008]